MLQATSEIEPLPAVSNLPEGHAAHTVEMDRKHAERLLSHRHDILQDLETAVSPFGVRAAATSQGIRITGDKPAVVIARRAFEAVSGTSRDHQHSHLTQDDINEVVDIVLKTDLAYRLPGLTYPVLPTSLAQVAYMDGLLSNNEPLIFGIGPTGTGKTHLAVAAGLHFLASDRIKHLILTRPHIVLEGEVVTPAVRAERVRDDQFEGLVDVLHNLISHVTVEELMVQRKLELTPLGTLRGRTFNDAFIILDEAQHTTVRTMRMAVTRVGSRSRMVVTGDPNEGGLQSGEANGLRHLLNMIDGKGIGRVYEFKNQQIMRNRTVARLEALYAENAGEAL